jgi:hypothetical protein
MNAELPLLVRKYVFFQILGYFGEENPPTYRNFNFGLCLRGSNLEIKLETNLL